MHIHVSNWCVDEAYLEMVGASGRESTPESRLQKAVLARAILDYLGMSATPNGSKSKRGRQESYIAKQQATFYETAACWIYDDEPEDDDPFSFQACCSGCGADWLRVREQVEKMKLELLEEERRRLAGEAPPEKAEKSQGSRAVKQLRYGHSKKPGQGKKRRHKRRIFVAL